MQTEPWDGTRDEDLGAGLAWSTTCSGSWVAEGHCRCWEGWLWPGASTVSVDTTGNRLSLELGRVPCGLQEKPGNKQQRLHSSLVMRRGLNGEE